MVGVEGGDGGPATGLTAAAVRAGYDAAAQMWASGPAHMYAVLAQALLAAAPVPVAGRRVLDLGAGTGVAGRAALAAEAGQVVAADLAPGMLRLSGAILHPVAADAAALPFRDGSFDLVVAAFCLNHLTSIVPELREVRRVAPAIAASTFAAGWSHPAKDAVDGVLHAAGFGDVRVRTVTVATGLSSPAQLASWRLGMAHVAPFLRALDAAAREEIRRAAERAVASTSAGPLVVPMVVLAAK